MSIHSRLNGTRKAVDMMAGGLVVMVERELWWLGGGTLIAAAIVRGIVVVVGGGVVVMSTSGAVLKRGLRTMLFEIRERAIVVVPWFRVRVLLGGGGCGCNTRGVTMLYCILGWRRRPFGVCSRGG